MFAKYRYIWGGRVHIECDARLVRSDRFRERLPEARSGKIMRRLLKPEELGVDPDDLTTLEE